MSTFIAELSNEEVIRFIKHFYSLEIAKTVDVRSSPNTQRTGFIVALEETIGAGLLEKAFKDGMLHRLGWHKKFVKK